MLIIQAALYKTMMNKRLAPLISCCGYNVPKFLMQYICMATFHIGPIQWSSPIIKSSMAHHWVSIGDTVDHKWGIFSVTRKKLPNVYKSSTKMISLEKWMILTPWHKLPKNVGYLGKLTVATSFEWLPKVQKIDQSGHTVGYFTE